MAVARFLQVSDLHLGRPFGWLSADRRADRRSDQRRALERVVREAIERGVHAILIPGDLFDEEGADAETMAFALHAFRVAGCPPVLIAPGNHDPYSESSHNWSPRLLKARGTTWPEHVHVFTSPEWSAKELDALPGARVWGRCFTSNGLSSERPLSAEALRSIVPVDASGLDLALLHGSREGQCPPSQNVTAPFSDAEAQASPFSYIAAGHYHAGTRLASSGGRSGGVRLSYAGSAVAIDATELGAHGALDVRVEFGFRQPFVEIEFVELDRRKVFELAADLSGASSGEVVDRRVMKALDDAGVGEADLATVRLTGRLVRGVRYSGPGAELKARVFHLRVDLRGVRPDYDLDVYLEKGPTTTEDRFACALLEKLVGERDPEQRAILESALYYGLDAFRLREVVPSYDEMGE
ncbi:MAG: DNA repair exonuclease [Candidatus Eisenbacteria bacterium]|nr:DNA repair exonuclease [Candidatus Eisenbacteria bacterium]